MNNAKLLSPSLSLSILRDARDLLARRSSRTYLAESRARSSTTTGALAAASLPDPRAKWKLRRVGTGCARIHFFGLARDFFPPLGQRARRTRHQFPCTPAADLAYMVGAKTFSRGACTCTRSLRVCAHQTARFLSLTLSPLSAFSLSCATARPIATCVVHIRVREARPLLFPCMYTHAHTHTKAGTPARDLSASRASTYLLHDVSPCRMPRVSIPDGAESTNIAADTRILVEVLLISRFFWSSVYILDMFLINTYCH